MTGAATPRRYDWATFLQGATAGLTMSLIAFVAAQRSLTAAGVFSAAVGVGMLSSRVFRRFPPRVVGTIMLVTRTAALGAAYAGILPAAIILGAVAGSTSRRLFLDLKHRTGAIDAEHLVAHGTWNAIGFGVGTTIAGFTLAEPVVAQLCAFTLALGAYVMYPRIVTDDTTTSAGLTRRDMVASAVFSFATNPLTNATAPILLLGVVGSAVAGMSSLLYTLGGVLAPAAARLLQRTPKPVAVATAIAGLSFGALLTVPVPAAVLAIRFVNGMLLFAAQGILEMRAMRDGEGHGLETLWTWLSAATILASFVVPASVDTFGLWVAPVWPLAGAVVIASLARAPFLR